MKVGLPVTIISESGLYKMIMRSDKAEDEQTTVKRVHLGMKLGLAAKVVSESGLYKLIMRSFKKIEHGVSVSRPAEGYLPTLRQAGVGRTKLDQSDCCRK